MIQHLQIVFPSMIKNNFFCPILHPDPILSRLFVCNDIWTRVKWIKFSTAKPLPSLYASTIPLSLCNSPPCCSLKMRLETCGLTYMYMQSSLQGRKFANPFSPIDNSTFLCSVLTSYCSLKDEPENSGLLLNDANDPSSTNHENFLYLLLYLPELVTWMS